MYRKGSDELAAARAELVSYATRLLDDGLAVGSAGNLSVRMGDIVAITPSGIPYADLRPADICLVTPAGAQLDEDGTGHLETPSSETPMHLAIYAAASAAAVVHTHSPEVTYGRHLAQACERALLLEWLARTYRLALSYGEPATLSPGELDEVAAETRPRRSGQTGNVPPCTSRARRRYSSSPTSTSTGSAAAGHCVAARHRGRRRGHHRLRRRLHRGHAGRPAARGRAGRRGSLVATGLGSDAGIEGLGQVLDFLGRAQPAVAGRIAAAAAGPLIHEGADG